MHESLMLKALWFCAVLAAGLVILYLGTDALGWYAMTKNG